MNHTICLDNQLLVVSYLETNCMQQALGRIAVFYEDLKYKNQYISQELWEQSIRQDTKAIYYEGYNFPVSAISAWLSSLVTFMVNKSEVLPPPAVITNPQKLIQYISSELNQQEAQVLQALFSLKFINIYQATDPIAQTVMLYESASCSILHRDGTTIAYDMPYLVLETTIKQRPLQYLEPQIIQKLVNSLQTDDIDSVGRRYLLAIRKNDTDSLRHEAQHAVYFLDKEYKQLCYDQWFQVSEGIKKVVKYELQQRGYIESVLVDEFQAYVACDSNEFGQKYQSTLEVNAKHLVQYSQPYTQEIVRLTGQLWKSQTTTAPPGISEQRKSRKT